MHVHAQDFTRNATSYLDESHVVSRFDPSFDSVILTDTLSCDVLAQQVFVFKQTSGT